MSEPAGARETRSDRLSRAVVPRLAYGYLRLLRATMRLSWHGREVLERERARAGHYILAFWHSRFLMMPYVYDGPRLVVLVSRHRDGRLLVDILRRFGLEIASGSSTAGGAVGVRQILRLVREGCDVGFTPDGPRGPRRRVKPGVIATARLTGLPVIPVTFSARPARRLGSWDRTLVPYPFARGRFLYGEPLRVARGAGEDACERARRALEDELDRLTDRADAEVGLPPEPAAERACGDRAS